MCTFYVYPRSRNVTDMCSISSAMSCTCTEKENFPYTLPFYGSSLQAHQPDSLSLSLAMSVSQSMTRLLLLRRPPSPQ